MKTIYRMVGRFAPKAPLTGKAAPLLGHPLRGFATLRGCLLAAAILAAPAASAALPSLSGLADSFSALQTRFAETTNALAAVRADAATLRERLDGYAKLLDVVAKRIDEDANWRKLYHGAVIGKYQSTEPDGYGREYPVITYLYADGFTWKEYPTARRRTAKDPEAEAKAKAAIEEARARWEAEHLPASVAALLAERRAAATTTNETTVTISR